MKIKQCGAILQPLQWNRDAPLRRRQLGIDATAMRANRLPVCVGSADAAECHFRVGVLHLEYLASEHKLKDTEVTYADLAKRLRKHGLKETEASITNKLARGIFPATFFLACIAALELEGVALDEI